MVENQSIFRSHKDMDCIFLKRVIALKKRAWPYSEESQKEWMRDNLRDDDLHVILMQDGKDIAYLNMCNVRCVINGTDTQCIGIGNVCSAQVGGVNHYWHSRTTI